MGDTQRQRLEAREEAILEAAASLFSESGVDGARMAAIAKKADVAEGTVYLYYKNKHELLEAVVDRFWRELTKGAKSAVTLDAPVGQQLTELASYHLSSLIDDFKIVEITSRARQRHGEPGRQLPQIREYVRVFDLIMQRGIASAELAASTPVWQMRDVFYGTLEHSARTLVLRKKPFDSSVIDNLVSLFDGYRLKKQPQDNDLRSKKTALELLHQLESEISRW